MFELDRFHSQALARFDPRKLAMSLLGGAGKIRTHVRDRVTRTKSERECRTLNRKKWCSGERTEATWLPAEIGLSMVSLRRRVARGHWAIKLSLPSFCCLCGNNHAGCVITRKVAHRAV